MNDAVKDGALHTKVPEWEKAVAEGRHDLVALLTTDFGEHIKGWAKAKAKKTPRPSTGATSVKACSSAKTTVSASSLATSTSSRSRSSPRTTAPKTARARSPSS
ncbi:MAG: hypothetical protein U0235_14230 [Polyangiaceae bacterium]